MQVTMTRQDLQGAMDYAKNRIIERMVSRSEVQTACDHARDRIMAYSNTLYQQQQQYLKQVVAQADQQVRRTASVEVRITSLEQEVKSLKQIMFDLLNEQRQLNSSLASLPEDLATTARKQRTDAQPQTRFQAAYQS